MSKEKRVAVAGLIVVILAALGLLALSAHRIGWLRPSPEVRRSSRAVPPKRTRTGLRRW